MYKKCFEIARIVFQIAINYNLMRLLCIIVLYKIIHVDEWKKT